MPEKTENTQVSLCFPNRTPDTDCQAGLFPANLGKGPWPKLGKMIDLTAKSGEINDIKNNKVAKYILKIKLF